MNSKVTDFVLLSELAMAVKRTERKDFIDFLGTQQLQRRTKPAQIVAR